MSLAAACLEIVDEVARHVSIPAVDTVWFPDPTTAGPGARFGLLTLEGGATGIAWAGGADAEVATVQPGNDAVELAKGFHSASMTDRIIATAALNAIAQHALALAQVELDTTTDPLAPFVPEKDDRFGMVGYFPPLVRRLRTAEVPTVVLEQEQRFLDKARPGIDVTLDPRRLRDCNKVVCTSTVMVNGTLDEVLDHCSGAELVALVGPSAGFFPDPLFDRGVHVVGATWVDHPDRLLSRCRAGQRWGDATRKYSFWQQSYPGYRSILERLPQR